MMPHPGVARTLYRAKKDLITRSQLDPHSTCSNGRPRSINDPTQTLIIRSFASIAVRAARWQPWPGDVIVARSFLSQLPGPSAREGEICLSAWKMKDESRSALLKNFQGSLQERCNTFEKYRIDRFLLFIDIDASFYLIFISRVCNP